MHRISLAAIGLLSLALSCPEPATAGASAMPLATTCEEASGVPPTGEIDTSVHPFATVNGTDSIRTSTFLVRDSYQSGGIVRCYTDTKVELRNDPDGARVGITLEADSLSEADTRRLFADFRGLWRGAVEVWEARSVQRGLCRAGECGGIAALDLMPMLELGEDVLGADLKVSAIVIRTLRGASDPAAHLTIPFFVKAVGDDDWLEMSNRGRVFWRMPTRELTPGHLYFAVIPLEFLTPGSGVWTVFLDSKGIGDSIVYVPIPSEPAWMGPAPAR